MIEYMLKICTLLIISIIITICLIYVNFYDIILEQKNLSIL